MKVFNRDEKINFVDDNNVLVGFDYSSICCERFGYLYSKTVNVNIVELDHKSVVLDHDCMELLLDGWNFDKTFKKDIENGVAFRLTKNKNEIFLILYNIQNGYYSHGFDMLEDGKVIYQGSL